MGLNKIFKSALSYSEYRELANNLVAGGKTTGNNQSEKLLEFTMLNIQRMNRIDKTIQLVPEIIQKLNRSNQSCNWLLIGDAWCGDCAQIIPVINKIAESMKGKAVLKIVSRDTYPELIEKHLSNGAKAIPKLLILCNKTGELLCTWGPRPKPAQEIMLDWKNNKGKISWEDFEKQLHLWYARDKGQTIINEFIDLMEVCERKTILQP
ncbi:MAG: thioredoxin family protein [Bacteroidota bacterium]|nr:thioredoxin family protein [Bacteroidota bacterium]